MCHLSQDLDVSRTSVKSNDKEHSWQMQPHGVGHLKRGRSFPQGEEGRLVLVGPKEGEGGVSGKRRPTWVE